jgi:DNA polymerase bacteriophage-type
MKKQESICVIDLETRSPAPITGGPARYFAPDTAAIICIGYAIDGGPVKTAWLLDGAPLPAAITNHKGKFVAHNWFFEFSAFLRFYPDTRLATPSNWLCTQALARRLQVGSSRASLHEVCGALDIPSPKSDETKRLINTYSIPETQKASVATGKILRSAFRPIPPADKKLWLEYVASDVTAERAAFDLMAPHWSEAERAVFAVDTVQQARGVPIDVKGAERLQAKLNDAKESAATRAEEIAGRNDAGTLILSGRDEFLKWLDVTHGVKLANAQAATLAAFEDENELSDDLAEALAIRSLLQSRATGKAQKILDLQHGGRVYKPSEYHLAHTGRWQSWGVNFFNFSRKSVEPSKWETALNAARKVSDFAALMRGLVCAPKGRILITTDWRGIENYLSLFYAGDAQQLKRVEAGESQYLIFGESLFGRKITKADTTEYMLAKQGVLLLGYGGGQITLSRATRIQTGMIIPAEEAQRIVRVWRNANRAVVTAWKRVEQGFRAALAGETVEWHGFTFNAPRKGLVIITLPNGYELRYPHAGMSSNGELYYAPQGKPHKIYGGLIWENLMQCLCGQILRQALVDLERRGVQVMLHVYDEIIAECATKDATKTAALIADVMRRAPEWAPDMKLEVEQQINRRWGK